MKTKHMVLTSLFFLITFICITFLSFYKEGFIFDEAIILWANTVNSPLLVQILETITKIGSSEIIVLLTLLIILVLIYKKDWFNSLFFLTLSFGGVFLNFLLKILFQRERPGDSSYIEVFNYSLEIVSYSFPSGHTMRSVILFIFVIYLSNLLFKTKPLRYLSYSVSLLVIFGVSLSRIVLDVHYFSDVIAAVSISIAWFCFCMYLFVKNANYFEKDQKSLQKEKQLS
ncbi:hypothetical protein SYNTR_0018 [Candidatus Syntrophocurvum alkaliphilum]|uniref:Phosphatidic acid phosphatase type 2/haloperoxidase domain-containing protein n=1 Tax=Candidatus Syntrophocurvum alkaliphilum TaxID=2293317 RepID=A0A6I6DDD0_9FIRM|nr:phosphatase PAP2 family protein [Candidatus Syntrophocurvum alkaliphilum]QGT98611.1 hypothetical protein SYNTR_0018 [Candidatus Syntrophocurvum alkaliphilum]